MKKILVALDNLEIYNTLTKSLDCDFIEQDIIIDELVIEFLSKNKVDIVITKDSLQGEMTKEIYIKQLRMIAPNTKIIVYVEELNNEYKSFLFANEVFNIIEGNEFDINIIKENIEENNKNVYIKNLNNSYLENKSTVIREIKNNVISKQIVSIYGTSGAGKSYIASLLAKKIYEEIKIKILLWDMDVENANVDIYNDIDNSQNVLRNIVDEIDKGTFNREFLENVISKNKDIDYLINNSTIYDYQEKLSEDYYKVIKEEVMKSYDLAVVDLASMPLLDSVGYFLNISTHIFFVVNPNYISIRQALKYLEIMTNLYDISKNKINIIVNKIGDSSLSMSQVKSLLGGYEVLLQIPYSSEVEKNINGIREFYISDKIDFKKLYKLFGIDITYKQRKYNFFNLKSRNRSALGAVGEDNASKYI